MTTKKILLAAGSAALLANFAFGQDPPPPAPLDPAAPVQAQQTPVAPDPQQPAPPDTGWRKFGSQTSNVDPNAPAPPPAYGDPQQGPPPNYQGPPPNYQGPPPNYQGNMPQQGPYYGPQTQGAPNSYAYRPPPPLPAQMTLPPGTWLKVHIDRVLSSNHNKVGDVFTGTLAQPLIVNGYVIARRGQNITGKVSTVAKAGRVKGTSELGLEISEVAIADGQQLPLKTTLVEYHGPSTKGQDAFGIGATTLLGAAIGGAVNGGVGAGVGAAAGLVVSTVAVLSTRGRPTVIFPESLLTFKTIDPIPFTTANSTYSFQPAGPQDYTPAMQTRTMYGPRPYGPYGYPYAYGYPYPGYYGYGYPYPFYGGFYFRGGFGRRW